MRLSSDEKRFFQADLTTNTFIWLNLSQKLERALNSDSKSSIKPIAHIIDGAYSDQPTISRIGSAFGVAGFLLGLAGISSLVGYTKEQPANLWFVLGLFALWPLLTAVLSVWRDARPSHSPWLQSLLALLKRKIPLVNEPLETHQQSALLLRWVSWKWQYFSLSFTVGSLVGFFVIIAFWDISFGWTSTLANSQQWMTPLIRAITWPSHILLGAPSIELIEASLISRHSGSEPPDLLRLWWPYVMFSMFLYGFCSRLILCIWKYFRLKSAIIEDIRLSGLLHRYNAMLTESKSIYTEMGDMPASAGLRKGQLAELDQSLLLGWQYTHDSFKPVYNFGVQSWQEDLNWLSQLKNVKPEQNLLILVNIYQTPVIELIDIVKQIAQTLPTSRLKVGLFVTDQSKQSIARFEKSWQQFSKKHSDIQFMTFEETAL